MITVDETSTPHVINFIYNFLGKKVFLNANNFRNRMYRFSNIYFL